MSSFSDSRGSVGGGIVGDSLVSPAGGVGVLCRVVSSPQLAVVTIRVAITRRNDVITAVLRIPLMASIFAVVPVADGPPLHHGSGFHSLCRNDLDSPLSDSLRKVTFGIVFQSAGEGVEALLSNGREVGFLASRNSTPLMTPKLPMTRNETV